MRLSEVLGHFEEPAEEADGFVARCPAHGDSHASLRVALDDNGVVLLKCRAGCETPAIIQASGLKWADLFGVTDDMDAPEARTGSGGAVDGADQALLGAYLRSCADRLQADGEEAAEYLWARFGVDREMAAALGLGFDPGHGAEDFHLLGAVHHQVPRLVVPFRDAEGVPRGFQARALRDHRVRWSGPTNPPGGGSWSKLAFFESGSGTDFVVVTEGPGDALASVAAGVDSVGIRGAALGAGVAESLSEALSGRRVVLAGDRDQAGQEMNVRLAGRLQDLGVDIRILPIPEGFGDVSEWREGLGDGFPRAFQEAVFGAPPFERSGGGDSGEEPEPERVPESHVEVAKIILDRFQGRLVYVIGLGFHIYEQGSWRPDTKDRVRLEVFQYGDEVSEEIDELNALENPTGDEADRERRLRRLLQFVRRSQEIDRILKEVGTLSKMGNEDFDRHPDLLTVRNGVVDLRSGTLLPHDPELYMTQIVDVDFVPDAVCPRWESFLQEVFPEVEDMPGYVQRLVGYGITGHTREQCFAVLWGRGANGKSVFTETISDVFSGISRTTPFETFEDKRNGGIPNDIAALRGARLVFASEGERGKAMAESVLKRLTGQDKITARFMRREFFEFRPSFLIFMASNHKPHFRSADEGLWRRVKMIPWARYFAPDERDPYLHQTLVAEEAEGILAWAVRGSVAWYGGGGLQETETVKAATSVYRDSQDPLASFYPHGPLVPEKDAEEKAVDVWEAYLKWCDDEMMPVKERWGKSTFYAGLEERGLVRKRTKTGYVMIGCKLKESM